MEDYVEFRDFLCFAHDGQIKLLINEEQLLLSEKLKILYFLFNIPIDRNLIITNNSLFNLEGKSKIFFN